MNLTKISLGYNAVPESAVKLIVEVMQSGQFSPGPKVREFEEKFAELHKAKYAVFVNSGTDALRLSLLALKEKYKWQDGDEVAVPAITFVSTVNVVIQSGLKPFFVDVGMHDYCLNPYNLERRINGTHSKLVAMMPVHLFGQSCEDYTFEVARKYKLKIIEDSCETILNPIKGDVSCFSTYMAHHVTTGVGGFAVTNDDDLNWMVRSYANHGRDHLYLPGYSTDAPLSATIKKRFRFNRVGYSCRGTEFEAALGLSQMDEAALYTMVRLRRSVAAFLIDALSGFPDLHLPQPSGWDGKTHTWMMFPIVLKEDSKIDKYDLCLHLEKAGIETRDMMPITNQPCYKDMINEDDFPVAKWINRCGFYIPCNQGMTKEDVGQIEGAFRSYLQKQ